MEEFGVRMAQGNSKKRSDKFSVVPKRKSKAPKPLGPRQGRIIYPQTDDYSYFYRKSNSS